MNSHKWPSRDGAGCEVYENGRAKLGRHNATVPVDVAVEMIRLADSLGQLVDEAHAAGVITLTRNGRAVARIVSLRKGLQVVAPAALIEALVGELTGGNWADNGKYHLLVAIGHNPTGEPCDVLHLGSSDTLEGARAEARKQGAAILGKAKELDVKVPWEKISIAHGNELPHWFEPIDGKAG